MNKKVLNIILLPFGLCLLLFGFLYFRDDSVKNIGGACIGIGAGLASMSFSNLMNFRYFKKHPDKQKETDIEFRDERNTMIRNRAKAKSADIIQWLIMGLAYLSILLREPMWVTLVIVGVFLAKFILELYFMSVYQKTL